MIVRTSRESGKVSLTSHNLVVTDEGCFAAAIMRRRSKAYRFGDQETRQRDCHGSTSGTIHESLSKLRLFKGFVARSTDAEDGIRTKRSRKGCMLEGEKPQANLHRTCSVTKQTTSFLIFGPFLPGVA